MRFERNQQARVLIEGVIVMAPIMVWGLLTLNALTAGNVDEFQRTGSIGCAMAVFSFSVSQMFIERVVRNHEKLKFQELVKLANTSDVGQVDWDLIKHADEVIDQHHWAARYDSWLQIVVLGIATLQWGYGDLLLTFLYKNDWIG